jgi:triacylglycerol lipase
MKFQKGVSAIILAIAAITATACTSETAADDSAESDVAAAVRSAGAAPKATQYPIMMVHGYGGSDHVFGYNNVARFLKGRGFTIALPALPPYNSPERRAEYLAKDIDALLRATGARKVNIVAHSYGGFDARALVSGLGYGDRVASISTIGTPHRGTLIADYSLPGFTGTYSQPAMEAFARWLGRRVTTDDLANDEDVLSAVKTLSEQHSESFNQRYKNDARVYYQSWAGVSARLGVGDSQDDDVCEKKLSGKTDVMNGLLTAASLITSHGTGLQDSFRPNDGMVTVSSAKWGNFRGCIRADHIDEMSGLDGKVTRTDAGFYAYEFYENLAVDLAKRGF